MAKIRSKAFDKIIGFQDFNYNGIKVYIGNRKEVKILPAGQTTWLSFDKDQLMEEVRKMPSNSTVIGVPRDTMWEWLNYDFTHFFE